MAKKTVKDLELKDKKVLVRADFNVPLDNEGRITNDNRIRAALPTLEYIIQSGGKIIVFSHLGRVKEESDKKQLTMRPVAERLSELLERPVQFVPETRGQELEAAVDNLEPGDVLMFENTRFEDLDGKKESGNDEALGAYWAGLGDVFINDAFGTAHREHASNVGIARHASESAVGFLIQKEIEFIGGAVDHPKRPFIAILGGAKVSDKIGVIESLLEKADKVLIGGAMAYTFLKARGLEVGDSLLEADKVDLAKELLDRAGDRLVLPVDTVVAAEFSNDAPSKIISGDIPSGYEGLDIGPKTLELFEQELQGAQTVVWNGPMGVFEFPNFAKGTEGVCHILAGLTDATVIIGGGDSATAVEQLGYAEQMSHISTGGGASLEYLEGKVLPGIAAIDDRVEK